MRWQGRVTLAALVFGLMADGAAAQTTTKQPRWQVEVVGGGALFELPTSGEAALPPLGPSLTTSSPANPSRAVPTWFLADGASLVNGADREFGIAAQLPPIDSALGALGLTGSNAPVAGLRVRRYLSSRFALEGSAEIHLGASDIDPALLEAADVARAGFVAAFTGLFSTGPFSTVSVNATTTTSSASARELALSGAVRFHLTRGRTSPYLTAGVAVVSGIGARPSLRLQGDYRFTFLNESTFAESDTLTVRFDQSTGFAGVAGAGVASSLGERWVLSVDGRVYVGAPTLSMRLDSSPSVTTATPAGVVESFTTPAVQFSNSSSTGRASTLSGTPLNGFKAFSTSGVQLRYVVTVGLAIRF
jgi:hypothetical protein